MSDAACGPSNSLQQFKQQTQVDRTLQQDRLTGRSRPGQGFRSADPNAGLLDPEFEAFQAGLPPPDFQSFQPNRPGPPPFQQAFQEPPQAQAPSWANDFQRMNISSPLPMQQQHGGPSTSNWAQDFRSNIAQSAPRAQNSSPSPFAFQQRARYGGMGGFQSNFAQPAYSPAMQSKGKEPAAMEQFDEAAFERAFDMAKEDMMVDDVTPASTVENAQTERNESAAFARLQRTANLSQESHQLNQSDIQDTLDTLDAQQPLDINNQSLSEEIIREEQKESSQDTREDDDALAATAQELLEKVEHNQTDKFRNSQFLGLMRKLRDREVKVEGDKMVETVSATQTQPKRTLTPDSGYDSGATTPLPNTTTIASTSTPHNPTLCKVAQCDVLEDHRWDHWETSTSTADLPLNSHPSTRFNNSEQIPRSEQDLDANRNQPIDSANDGADVVNLLSQPGLPGGEPSDPISQAPDSDPSNLNFTDDIERRRLSDMWRNMLPNSGPDRRTHSAGAEESGLGGTAFTA